MISFQIFPIVGVGARTIAMRLGVNAAAIGLQHGYPQQKMVVYHCRGQRVQILIQKMGIRMFNHIFQITNIQISPRNPPPPQKLHRPGYDSYFD